MTQHQIVVISDSERLRDVIQSALAGDNYRVSSISSAFTDVRAVAALRPDLLILDWLLGCEDHGLQVLQIVQLYQPLSDLPTIVCSAPIALVHEIERWLRGSSIQFLLKPFRLPELHQALHSALGITTADTPVAMPAVAPAVGRLPGERNAERWRSAQPRLPLMRRGDREWSVTVDGPGEEPLTGETAAAGG